MPMMMAKIMIPSQVRLMPPKSRWRKLCFSGGLEVFCDLVVLAFWFVDFSSFGLVLDVVIVLL